MKTKTYLCRGSEAESSNIIAAFSAIDRGTTPDNNNDGRCIIVVADTVENAAIAALYDLQDVTDYDDEENDEEGDEDIAFG